MQAGWLSGRGGGGGRRGAAAAMRQRAHSAARGVCRLGGAIHRKSGKSGKSGSAVQPPTCALCPYSHTQQPQRHNMAPALSGRGSTLCLSHHPTPPHPSHLTPPHPTSPSQLQRHNLTPALEWVREHEAALAGPGGQPSAFEFGIRRLAFLTLLKEQGERRSRGWVGW